MLFSPLIVLRFVSLIVFTTYDTNCFIFANASVIDCQQPGIVPNAQSWIIAWFVLSIISSASFFLIVYNNWKDNLLNFQYTKATAAKKKGSFISFFVLLLATVAYYCYRMTIGPSGVGMAISVLLFFWPVVIFFVVLCFNYTPRVSRRKSTDCCSKSCFCSANCCSPSCCQFLAKKGLFFFYWSALVMYFFEVACIWLAVALDATQKVGPLIEKKFPGNSSHNKPFHVLLLGFTLAFYSRALCFFWQKLFHGDKDLFSAKYGKLVDDQVDGHPQNQPPQVEEGTPPASTSKSEESNPESNPENGEAPPASTSVNRKTPPASNPPIGGAPAASTSGHPRTQQGTKRPTCAINPKRPPAPSQQQMEPLLPRQEKRNENDGKAQQKQMGHMTRHQHKDKDTTCSNQTMCVGTKTVIASTNKQEASDPRV